MNFRLLTLLMLLAWLLCACGGEPSSLGMDVRARAAANNIADANENSADEQWDSILKSGEMEPQRDGEWAFLRLLRDVELSNQRRRALGLAFWQAHPDDSRRFQWLIRAAHLEPYYPTDLNAWAEKEAQFGWNDTPVDVDARAAWNTVYPSLRDEFWSAPTTTERERRYLWYGELLNALTNAVEASARNENVDGKALTSEILAFAARFPESFEASDVSHTTAISGFWASVNTFSGRLGLTKADLDGFTASLRAVSPAVDNAIASASDAEGRRNSDRALEERPAQAWEWLSHMSQLRWNSSGRIDEGAYIFAHQRALHQRRFLEYGRQLWESVPDYTQQVGWYEDVLGFHPDQVFVSRIPDYASRRATVWIGDDRVNGNLSGTDSQLDVKALREWQAWRNTVPQGLVVQAVEERYELRELRALCQVDGDNSQVKQALQELVGYFRSGMQYADALLLSTVQGVRDEPSSYCLSHDEAEVFLETILELNDDRLSAIVAGPLAISELRTTPLAFTSETWDGGEFDIEDYRGTFVLMQFWDRNCAACFAAIPVIQSIEEEVGSDVFQVVSVNVDGDDAEVEVKRIRDQYGFDWPLLRAHAQWPILNERFGWGYKLPQYWLFGRNGLLVAHTPEIGSVMRGGLYEKLNELLMSEAATKGD